MGMPTDIGIVDTMIGFPHGDMKEVYRFITRQTKDAESKEKMAFPAEYMFKQVPERALEGSEDPVGITLREMDRWGIERGLIGCDRLGREALAKHPDRFIPSTSTDPNDGMEGIARLVKEYETYGVRAVGVFPAGTFPQVPINDKKMYPIYAKCVELGLPVFVCAGVPGPRLKAACRLHSETAAWARETALTSILQIRSKGPTGDAIRSVRVCSPIPHLSLFARWRLGVFRGTALSLEKASITRLESNTIRSKKPLKRVRSRPAISAGRPNGVHATPQTVPATPFFSQWTMKPCTLA